jgi:hypothetical protein
MQAFKIKDAANGKYSTGGMSPNWTSRGKVWNSKGALKAHLNQFCKDYMSFREGDSWVSYDGWWNNIPPSWIVEEVSVSGVIEYQAKQLYPETTGKDESTRRCYSW